MSSSDVILSDCVIQSEQQLEGLLAVPMEDFRERVPALKISLHCVGGSKGHRKTSAELLIITIETACILGQLNKGAKAFLIPGQVKNSRNPAAKSMSMKLHRITTPAGVSFNRYVITCGAPGCKVSGLLDPKACSSTVLAFGFSGKSSAYDPEWVSMLKDFTKRARAGLEVSRSHGIPDFIAFHYLSELRFAGGEIFTLEPGDLINFDAGGYSREVPPLQGKEWEEIRARYDELQDPHVRS
ncbi:hypothetical protein [Canibacter oris]|uniref:Uncharacterized protein n=1 Tax=Canibacter oris TaxID=1365628 RepID=A0A840DF75_9MICO|nr:hypothetical protein [Canibacter oris]MBB4071724.1 hypothetical protein [Canibacter oris]